MTLIGSHWLAFQTAWKRDKNIILLLSEYHTFPIRNNAHAVFQALSAFTSWQRSDWDTETQISGGVSGENSLFISLSKIIITHACSQTWDTMLSFFSFFLFSFFIFLPSFIHIYLWLFTYMYCIYCHFVLLCLFTLHNQRERPQRHCNYYYYYHKNNLCVYSHTRRIQLIESISFADDGFTFCHGGCCLISMLGKYGFIFWLVSADHISSALRSLIFALSLTLTISLTLPPPAEKWW